MKKIKSYLKRYFVDSMGAMALGLFASLLIGTIFATLGEYIGEISSLKWLTDAFVTIAYYAKSATGMAIGVAIAYKLGAHPLVIFSSAAVGAMGNALGASIGGGAVTEWAVASSEASGMFYAAGPAGAFIAVIIAAEVGMLVSKKTKVDIIVTPVVTLVTGYVACLIFCSPVAYVLYKLGCFIATATSLQPALMGIVVSVTVGIILTLPISSAAVCGMIFSESALIAATLEGREEGLLLAGGAAVAGCCAQMVGFAVSSFRENKWSGVLSQGLGTSMLQMGNICKNPRIWIPQILASAITGPIATMVFGLKCFGAEAGMGTCGLLGPIGIIETMEHTPMMWIGIVLVCFVLPAGLSLLFSEIMRRLGWIKKDDMLLCE